MEMVTMHKGEVLWKWDFLGFIGGSKREYPDNISWSVFTRPWGGAWSLIISFNRPKK